MYRHRAEFIVIVLAALLAVGSSDAPCAVVVARNTSAEDRRSIAKSDAQSRYDHGQPSSMAQHLLELVNRARANPAAELERLLASGDRHIQSALDSYDIQVDQLRSEFAAYSPQPPLSFNARLIEAAVSHSADMADNDFQSHSGSDGSDLATRLERVGYGYLRAGENVFAYAQSMLHGQAGFLIDWGVESLGHRKNLLNLGEHTDFREIGIGVVSENSPGTVVGPWVITQDFGTSSQSMVFITGVVYLDDNASGFYEPGEGLSGVEIRPDRGSYYAVTSESGGYAVPVVISSGTYTLTLGRSDLPQRSRQIVIGQANVKVDFIFGDPDLARIAGTVVDEAGIAVSGVELVLKPIGASTVTQSDGTFVFFDLPIANYQMTASCAGYDFQPNDFFVSLEQGESFEVRITARTLPGPLADDAVGGQDGTAGCGTPLVILLSAVMLACCSLQQRTIPS